MLKLLPRPNTRTTVQKICITGLLIALATIGQKVFAINYIPIIPFLRISFCGPAVIIFSSIFLGPIYGMIVGAFSDLLGYLIFDPKTMGFFPQITAIYAVLGFVSYLIFVLFNQIKSERISLIIKYALILAIILGAVLFLIFNDNFALYGTEYELNLTTKIIVISFIVVFTAITEVIILLLKKISRLKNTDINVTSLNLSLIVIELLIMVGFGTLMKGFAFGFATYPAILFCQILVLFFNIPVNLFFISLFLKLTSKYR